MLTGVEPHVRAANRLTGRWCAAAGDDDFVVSGAGVWPLLALLAATANQPARSELTEAVGLSAENAHAAALDLLRILDDSDSVSAALGVWVHRELRLHDEWLRTMPIGTVDLLTDQETLDAWAYQRTGGLVDKFPLRFTGDTRLVTALVARTQWRDSFSPDMEHVNDGPWQGHFGTFLSRATQGRTDATILEAPQPVTRVVVVGEADLDVHLLLGAGTPAEVLGAGLDALDGSVEVRTDLPRGATGPGLTVHQHTSRSPADQLHITVPPFDIRSSHDLCAQPELFGLTTALDDSRGHFPGLAADELHLERGAQDVCARFTAEGFEATAVTAFSVALAGGAPTPPPYSVLVTTVIFDRPFGFLTVHRPTGLVVAAGWIAQPPLDRVGLEFRFLEALHTYWWRRHKESNGV